MKYKIGDKVKILRVGDVTDPELNDWIGKVSRIEAVSPTSWRGDYYLENEFHAYEDELELVPEFKVGDRVVIAHAEGNDSSLRPNDKGVVCDVVCEVEQFPVEHPYEVEFPDGEKILYMGKELELALYVPVGTEKQKATTTFSLLGEDGFYYDAEFVNIGFELFRSYLFPATSRDTGMSVCDSKVYETLSDAHIVRIDNPKWLYVAPSGSHRIIDKHGRSHYIPCGWTHLWWLVEDKGKAEKKEKEEKK